MNDFAYHELLPVGEDTTDYRKLTSDFVETVQFDGKDVLKVDAEALKLLAREAFHDTSHYLRAEHLEQLAKILKDDEASNNDKFVAMELLKNANIAAGGVLPMCQDTGTPIVFAKKGQQVWTSGNDEAALSEGISRAYAENNLRYSQMAPLDMYEEVNTGDNLPAQIDILATGGDAYKLMFIAKGGGSANKAFLYQETKALLNPDRLYDFLEEKLLSIGTAACPPYHLALVIGGTSAEACMKTMKLASCHYLDNMPTTGNKYGQAFRDLDTEAKLLEIAQHIGVGAQFGGKYFAHDVRVIRLPRHGASCPVALGVSCSADRQVKAKITKEGVFLEILERNPAKHLPEVTDDHLGSDVVEIDLNKPMDDVRKTLSQHPIRTRLSLSGSLVVARDIAHAKLKERLDAGEDLPQYFKDHAVYYAGPAKTPKGMASGSFGPTTAGRMDSYVDQFQAAGGSMIMLAKGNRSQQVTDACKKHGCFYLGSIGGPAARLAQDSITKVEVIEYEELGMEAIWKIEIKDFPAFIVVDDKGNDFFAEFKPGAMKVHDGNGP
jgi:fumarate hydratase class I